MLRKSNHVFLIMHHRNCLTKTPEKLCVLLTTVFIVLSQRVGVQPRRVAVRVGHQVGRPRRWRHLDGVVEAAAVLPEDARQEGGEHPDHADRPRTGLLAVRLQQQQLTAAVQMIRSPRRTEDDNLLRKKPLVFARTKNDMILLCHIS